MKRCFCLVMMLVLLLPAFSALAGRERFRQAPEKSRIYRAETEKSITLMYGDARYSPGAIGMIYADRSDTNRSEIPLLVVYFIHNGNSQNTTLTVTTDKKRYKVASPSDLSKTGVPVHPNAFHVAVGPESIAMFQDMAKSKSVKITLGPSKSVFEIVLTAEKKKLISLIAAEYTGHIAKVYEQMDRLNRLKYVEHPAAAIQVSKAPAKSTSYQPLRKGDKGTAVRTLQRYLIHYGYLKGTVNGTFDETTRRALMKYQQKLGQRQSGWADAGLLKRLYAKEIPWQPAVSVKSSRIVTEKKKKYLHVSLKNTDCEFTVTGVTMVLRFLDKNGRVITDGNGKNSFTYTVRGITLAPGKSRSSKKDRADISKIAGAKSVQAGVIQYTLKGGTTVNVPTESIKWVKIK